MWLRQALQADFNYSLDQVDCAELLVWFREFLASCLSNQAWLLPLLQLESVVRGLRAVGMHLSVEAWLQVNDRVTVPLNKVS